MLQSTITSEIITMGKENAEMKRTSEAGKMPVRLISKQNLYKELAKQWSSKNGFASKKDIAEDGYAMVIVRTAKRDIPVTCKGLSNEGNTFDHLLNLLEEKGIILNHNIDCTFFTRRGFSWEIADRTKARFRSGDVLLMTQKKSFPGIKKTIRHVRLLNKKSLK